MDRIYSNIMNLMALRFASRWLVFICDMLLSIAVSYVALTFYTIFLGENWFASDIQQLPLFILSVVLANAAGVLMFRIHVSTLRYSTFTDAVRILFALIIKGIAYIYTPLILDIHVPTYALMFCMTLDLLLSFSVQLIFRMIVVVSYRLLVKNHYVGKVEQERILIYLGSKNPISAMNAVYERLSAYNLVGYLRSGARHKMRIADHPIYFTNDIKSFRRLVSMLKIDSVLFTSHSDLNQEKEGIVRYCERSKIKMLIMTSANIVEDGSIVNRQLPKVKIEDLLGREEIKIDMDRISNELNDKVVLVTGAAGSIGSEICRQVCCFKIRKLLLFDNAETPMHDIRLELTKKFPDLDIVFIMGCVRQREKIDSVMQLFKPNVVFHAAAYKHVPMMEDNPCEAIQTNIGGTRNLADMAVAHNVERFVMVSTDKAVNPTNVMGASKRTAEIYVQSLGEAISRGEIKGQTKFITTRFGNVLGSNGSVIPLFTKQIERGGPITVTHPDIIRYFMTIPEACGLVLEAGTAGGGNEIFVFDMGQPIKIVDLAKRMVEMAGLKLGKDIEIKFTGLRPGEKLFEELLACKESVLPTFNKKIFRAQTRQYEYALAEKNVSQLIDISKDGDAMAIVGKMKAMIPEYKSNNSAFETLDKNPQKEAMAVATTKHSAKQPSEMRSCILPIKPTIGAGRTAIMSSLSFD